VGGGLVGLTAALAFSQQERTVKLFEAVDLQPHKPSELDVRSIALSYSTMQIFRSLNLWDDLQAQSAAITDIHVSSAGHFGVTRLSAADLQLDAMGYVVEYHILIQVLLDAVKKSSSIELVSPAQVLSVSQTESSALLNVQLNGKQQTVEAALLVVADGAGSSVRDKLAIQAETKDYQQAAIIANLKIQQPSVNCAYERFTSGGPMAMLPLPEQRYAMVWTNTPHRAETLMQLSDDDFIHQVHQQFGYRLGFFSQVGKRVRFDLKLTRASRLVAGRAVLIGNAANALHPVAGQGFNLALRDIGLLFDLITDIDLQSTQLPPQLEQYELQRSADQNQTVQLSDWLVQLFSNNLPLLNHSRAGALAALDLCPWLKQEVSWQGMGYGSGCSSLMRGVR